MVRRYATCECHTVFSVPCWARCGSQRRRRRGADAEMPFRTTATPPLTLLPLHIGGDAAANPAVIKRWPSQTFVFGELSTSELAVRSNGQDRDQGTQQRQYHPIPNPNLSTYRHDRAPLGHIPQRKAPPQVQRCTTLPQGHRRHRRCHKPVPRPLRTYWQLYVGLRNQALTLSDCSCIKLS